MVDHGDILEKKTIWVPSLGMIASALIILLHITLLKKSQNLPNKKGVLYFCLFSACFREGCYLEIFIIVCFKSSNLLIIFPSEEAKKYHFPLLALRQKW